MKKAVKTDKAQQAKGLLSQAIVSENIVHTSGFIHMTPDGELVQGSVADKLVVIMNNLKEVLKEAGSSLDKVVKATIYVTDMSIVPELNKHYVEYFTDPLPAREAVAVKELPLGAEIEISVIAELD